MSIPYLTISNDEIKNLPNIYKNDVIKCPHCNGTHKVCIGSSKRWDDEKNCLIEENSESNVIQFFTCGEKTYICGIDNKAMPGIELVKT